MPTSPAQISEGLIDFPYQGEVHQTYYKVFGDLQNRTRTPIVVIHGGPGLSHDYLLPLADLADQSCAVILYDQIGNARSTHLPDKPPTFWTIELFIDELENLLKHFGVQEEYNIVGHSWGGMLACELVVQRQPPGLRRLVISDSPPSLALWADSNKEIIQRFPQTVQDAFEKGFEDREGYWKALMEVHSIHGCRVKPFPKDLEYSLLQVYGEDADRTVGKSPILKDWTIIDRLHLIRIPTLIINGRYDIAQERIVKPFADHIPNSKWRIFEDSSHTPFWEEREEYMRFVGAFLAGESS
ncbi:proline-specific peptidase [Trametes gibbosa]|nr:proline-specific peptidase [Trametes gibbosa]KAI0833556.1 proline-specific peptidase [Trametes gibbosa]